LQSRDESALCGAVNQAVFQLCNTRM
jgi:hypothetical protein